MIAQIIDGKAFADTMREALQKTVSGLIQNHGTPPGLTVILVGDDPASAVYVRNKHLACEKVGITSHVVTMDRNITEQELLNEVARLNADSSVHGILVQLPLPNHIDPLKVIDAIDPLKDVDGFHVINAGKLAVGQKGLVPCTPTGSLKLIKHALGENLAGKHAVVIGRSNIVGKPMAQLLLGEGCTVTICHSKTADLPAEVSRGDIVVAAVGRPQMVKGDWLKKGACVIDVGINRIDTPDGKGKLVGDVDFDSALSVAGAITPVPGGVGPMTIACLLENTVTAYELQQGRPAVRVNGGGGRSR